MPNHVLRNGGLGNGNAKLHQLAVHAGSPPERLARLMLRISSRNSGATPGRPGPRRPLPCPIASEAGAVPPDDRLGFHDDEDPIPISPDSAQEHPETAVHIREPWPFRRTMEHGELLSKGEILKCQRASCLERRDEGAKKRPNHAAMLTPTSLPLQLEVFRRRFLHPSLTPDFVSAQKTLVRYQGRVDVSFAGSYTRDVDGSRAAARPEGAQPPRTRPKLYSSSSSLSCT